MHLEYVAGKGKTLRFYIDGPNGVSIDDCANASRQISVLLDVEDDVVSGAYTLEVSSPGLDRPLGRLSDFERFVGQQAKLSTRCLVGGRRKWVGTIQGVEDEEIVLKTDGGTVRIPADVVKRAQLQYAFDDGGEVAG